MAYHLSCGPPAVPQIANGSIPVGLAQLLRRRLHDQRVMEKVRGRSAAEQTRQLNLAAGGYQQIVAPNDERHALHVVIDRHRKLIGPVPVTIPGQQVAALLERPLLQPSMTPIDEALDRGLQPNPEPASGVFRQRAIAARARIPAFAVDRACLRHVRPAACTRIDQSLPPQPIQRV